MKKWKLLIALMLCAMLAVPCALSQATLRTTIKGGKLNVSWSGVPAGMCTLTVYQDGWPAVVCQVEGGSGSKTIPLKDASASGSVRLATASGCLTSNPGTANGAGQPGGQSDGKGSGQSSTAPAKGTTNGGLASEVIRLVNQERAKAGLKELRVDQELTRAAQVRAAEIVRKFSHTRTDGSSWSTVSSRAYGENIAMGQRTADKVMAAWMSSSGHRANILRSSYGSIGVCAYVVNGVTYWVQLFGK